MNTSQEKHPSVLRILLGLIPIQHYQSESK